MRPSILTAALLAVACCGTAGAADASPASRPATSQPATPQPIAMDVSNNQAVNAHAGQYVAVEGTVTYAAWSATGKVFIVRLKEGQPTMFQATIFSRARPSMEKAFHGDLSHAFEGAKVRIAGKLQRFREHPEIVIDDPTQVTILKPPAPATPQARTAAPNG